MKRTIESLTPPENKQVMWLDVSGEVKQLKVYINGEWVVANDDTKNNEEIVNKVLKKISNTYVTYHNLNLALKSKADNRVFTDNKDGLVPSPNLNESEETIDPAAAVLSAIGEWVPIYRKDYWVGKGTFLAGPVDKIGEADFRKITVEDLPEDITLDNNTYGISWQPNVADPVVTRVGNMSYHKTLPIQNNMRGCIAQMNKGTKIMYFLDQTDWRWRDSSEPIVLDERLNVTGNTYTITNIIFKTLQYENQWLKIDNVPCQVLSIDTSTHTATIKPDSPIEEGYHDIELGAVLNGYDGEVMVLVPEFWIKSWDTEVRREVRISPSKIDDTWEHQPRILIAAYHDTVLNTVPKNMGYLSTLKVNSALSIANIHDYCRGGNNDAAYDQYITSDKFRSNLGKPRTDITRATMRANCRQSGKEILSYLEYKRVLYWLYYIEYANFDCQAKFNSELTSEGFRQGGLGEGVTTSNEDYVGCYNKYNPLTPNGYTNEFGNGTNIKAMVMPDIKDNDNNTYKSGTLYAIRWHGIENPFGDIGNIVDGVIINPNSIVKDGKKYSEVYATDWTSIYSDSNYNLMKVVGLELNEDEDDSGVRPIKEWDLGNTAEIIPRLHGGNATQYKCDYHYLASEDAGLRILLFGGPHYLDTDSGLTGLGFFASNTQVDASDSDVGFRSSCVI